MTAPSAVELAREGLGLEERRTQSFRWTPDHDDPESVDDLFARSVDVRMERMDNGHYWFCIYLADGTQHDFDITSKRKIRAFARQPTPLDKQGAKP